MSCILIWPCSRGLPRSKIVNVRAARSIVGRMCSGDGVLAIATLRAASSGCPVVLVSNQLQTQHVVATRDIAASRLYALAEFDDTAKFPIT